MKLKILLNIRPWWLSALACQQSSKTAALVWCTAGSSLACGMAAAVEIIRLNKKDELLEELLLLLCLQVCVMGAWFIHGLREMEVAPWTLPTSLEEEVTLLFSRRWCMCAANFQPKYWSAAHGAIYERRVEFHILQKLLPYLFESTLRK